EHRLTTCKASGPEVPGIGLKGKRRVPCVRKRRLESQGWVSPSRKTEAKPFRQGSEQLQGAAYRREERADAYFDTRGAL
ncbi:MAG: hypothetical protein IJH04_02365, partial [Eggerthellaceae bacterium]|nr:hypothetical protein [Eggerthellaceae bacterium]